MVKKQIESLYELQAAAERGCDLTSVVEVAGASKKAKQAVLKTQLNKSKGPGGRYSDLGFYNPAGSNFSSKKPPSELRLTKQTRTSLPTEHTMKASVR